MTVDDEYKNNYIDINRSSADVNSERLSIEPQGIALTKEKV